MAAESTGVYGRLSEAQVSNWGIGFNPPATGRVSEGFQKEQK
jgi:hypothetical protein